MNTPLKKTIDEICAEPQRLEVDMSGGLAAPIYPTSVYRCRDPKQAAARLSGEETGYVYQRDGHPNADLFAQKCGQLHQADWCLAASSGMAAFSIATLGLLQAGDHVILSDRLYGRTTYQVRSAWARLGVTVSNVDAISLPTVEQAIGERTRLIVVESLTNPMLRVAALDRLAALADDHGIVLLVDNTFATPFACQPIRLGAGLVIESVSKMLNGHSDVMLGAVCGRGLDGERFREASSVWGLASSPFDSWLATRGFATFHLRMERANQNAAAVAQQLDACSLVNHVVYPALDSHPDRQNWQRVFRVAQGGSIVTFDLSGGVAAVSRLMQAMPEIPFCPSLGEVSTTISHPASTSHRTATDDEKRKIGLSPGTLRLSVGTESTDWIWQTLEAGLRAI